MVSRVPSTGAKGNCCYCDIALIMKDLVRRPGLGAELLVVTEGLSLDRDRDHRGVFIVMVWYWKTLGGARIVTGLEF